MTETLNVDDLQAQMMAVHASGANLSYEWRIRQIKILQRLIQENEEAIREALVKDLGREGTEALAIETKPLEGDVKYVLNNLHTWMKPRPVPSPVVMAPAWSYVESKPLNAPGVLIVGPYNYPVRLILQPLLGALAGGNPTVVKPSDFTPNVGKLLKELLELYYTEPGVVQVVLGGVAETTALLEKKWGMVFFTGSARVGNIVLKACAETMTPTILELGGKCPVVVDETVPSSQIKNVADRIIFAKLINAGQTCVACDTLIVHKKHAAALAKALTSSIKEQFGEDQKKGELARIINVSNAKRVQSLIEDAESRGVEVVHGGSKLCDVETKYICPTLLLDPPKDSMILKEEIFGPVLPIVTVNSREEAIRTCQELSGEPLHLYVFTPVESVFREYINQCRCSGALRNDVIIQGASNHLPFGGMGTSGMGNYYGKFSFDTFTHAFPVSYRPLGSLFDLGNLRCHPYTETKRRALNVIFKVPDVPVLHTRTLLLLAGTGAIALGVPCIRSALHDGLIGATERFLEFLKR
eukprot:Nitzschia sp. Nitz4//scaffold144_size56818//4423//6000//NITZ4_006527-RA/size56818-processed-gene-0.63-mRNA-1//1//CDS//3329536486//7428//frame0